MSLSGNSVKIVGAAEILLPNPWGKCILMQPITQQCGEYWAGVKNKEQRGLQLFERSARKAL